MRAYNVAHYAKDPAAGRARVNRYHAENGVAVRERARARYAANPEAGRVKNRRQYAENPQRYVKASRAWQKNNPARKKMIGAAYRASKLKATPIWLTAIQKAQVQEFYEIATARTMQTGVRHEVDHVYPLQGKRSRGLHVPWNLQVLTQTENIKKKNKEPCLA
jgi:5-methylcytosine-specific restriction endonuclease McrA